jgi:hypothetical protein
LQSLSKLRDLQPVNTDAVLTYQDNFDVADNPATAVVEQWGQATSLLSPRFVRLTMQFDF